MNKIVNIYKAEHYIDLAAKVALCILVFLVFLCAVATLLLILLGIVGVGLDGWKYLNTTLATMHTLAQ